MIRAGFSRLDITPPVGTLMGGHPGVKRCNGVLDNLFCRAMVIESGATTIVFLSADLLFLDAKTVLSAREKTSQTSGIPSDRIFLHSTHTHSGPLTTGIFGASGERDYVDTLPDAFAAACQQAQSNLQQARIGFGKVRVPGIAFNARFIMKDGSIETHPQKGDPDIVAPEGPTDDELSVLCVSDMQGGLLGALVNFANHPQIMARRNSLLSADFPGAIERAVRQSFSNTATVVFGNGACGNICPVNAQDTENIELGEEWIDRTGKILAENCISIFKAATLEENMQVRTSTRSVKIPLRGIPEKSIGQAIRFLDETKAADMEEVELSDYGTETSACGKLSLRQFLQTPFWKRQEHTDLLALAKEQAKSPFETCEIAAVAIGQSAIVMVPFELFVELGLEIKAKSPFKNTMVVELSNGYSGYLPAKNAFSRHGGYETLTLRSSKLVPEAGEIVVSEVIDMCANL